MIPSSIGVYLTFPVGLTETSEFIHNKKYIKTAKVMECQLGQKLRDAIDKKYYMELEDPIFKYTQIK